MRAAAFLVCIFFILQILPAEEIPSFAEQIAQANKTEDEDEPAPYEPDEFSPALQQIRRSEVLFFGSLPITYLYSNLGFMAYTQISGNTLTGEDKNYTLLYASISLSMAVVVLDAVLGLTEE